jgi:hypothetical protein
MTGRSGSELILKNDFEKQKDDGKKQWEQAEF